MQLSREIARVTGVWRDPVQWRRICLGECTPYERTQTALAAFLSQSADSAR